MISPPQSAAGDIVGLIGPNGAGKTTLLRSSWGNGPPTAERYGFPIRSAWPTTARTWPRCRPTVRYTTSSTTCVPAGAGVPIQGHLGRFGFSGDSVLRRAATLSGGERARVALAMMMLSGANLLLFDEPTNHLDVESIEALEDAIEAYDGTVILVSHDRALLRALTTRMWVLHERADHRLSRRLRGMGDGECRAGPCRQRGRCGGGAQAGA